MSSRLARVRLVAGRERALLGGHPWVLSGSVARLEGDPAPGDLVQVVAADGRLLGVGDYDPGAQIRVRMLAGGPPPAPRSHAQGDWNRGGRGQRDKAIPASPPDPQETRRIPAPGPEQSPGGEIAGAPCSTHDLASPTQPDTPELPADWLERRLEQAVASREHSPLLRDTDAVRLVHAEADALPGLTIDRYADWAVVKPSTPAMVQRAEAVARWLASRLKLEGVWLRGELRGSEAPAERALAGSVPEEPIAIREGERRYWLDLRRGQKTGFYLDQRDSRELFQQLARGRRALDLYAYTGGFSVAACAGAATEVVAVESSVPARALLARNAPDCEVVGEDVGRFLESDACSYDLIAIDPPPFARHKRDVEAACRAYRELHIRAFTHAAPGADVLTYTCSHHVDAALFRRTVATAARAAGRRVQLLRILGAPCDHPVALSHPEGEYLSGLWLRIDGGDG